MTTIAIDPGISTGIAIHKLVSNDSVFDDLGYITVVIRNATDIWEVIDHHKPDVIVYENFQSPGLISTDGQATLRLIGAIEVICYRHNIVPIIQYPGQIHAQGAPWKPKARLMLKQIKKTPISHEIDALAHLLLYEHRIKMGYKLPDRRLIT